MPDGGLMVKHFSPSATARLAKISQLATFDGTQRVLEVGCGVGLVSALLVPRAGKFIGLEIRPEAVRVARRSLGSEHAHFVVGDATALPFRDGVFDGLVSSEVIEHLSEPRPMLTEASRVLRSGSAIVLTTPNGDLSKITNGSIPLPSLIWMLGLLTRHPKFKAPYGHFYGGITAAQLRSMLQSADFSVDKLQFCGWALTKLVDEVLYAAAVASGMTDELAWTENGGGLGFKVYRALFPLVKVLTGLDRIPLGLGLEGYITAVRAIRR